MENLLLIFAKEPKIGLVKTRLAREVGDALARDVYEAFLKDIVNNVTDSGSYESIVLITPESCVTNLKRLLDHDNFQRQKGDTLTERLGNAFSDGFSNGYRKIIAIGTDSPLIDSDTIKQAILMLDDHASVIGPASDGGYYLIGLKRYDPDIFSGILWSTNKVLGQTIKKLDDLDYSCFLMDEMSDIDTKEDLICLKSIFNKLTAAQKKRTLHLNNFFMKIKNI